MKPVLTRPDEVTIRYVIESSPLGLVLVAATEKGICAILMGDTPASMTHELRQRFPRATLLDVENAQDDKLRHAQNDKLRRLAARVIALIESPTAPSTLALDVRGTPFQRRVWEALQSIPPGTTATYTDIARRIGAPGAVRAVAQACGANPLAVAIPCHRVIRRDGSLSGYRWGTDRKRTLLEREAAL